MNKQFRVIAKPALGLGALAAGGGAFAQATDTALAAVGTLATSAAGFGPVMYGLAIAVVGIMVGVKWIKRARGAA